MRRAVWRWARLVGAAAILAVLVWREGTGPFLDELRSVDASAVAAAVAAASWGAVLAASAVVVAGHTATFLIAAHTAGVHASPARLLPLAMLVLIAMAVPLNVGGWGPREGVAAWAFGAAGLGAGAGVATATVYGVLVIAACVPETVVLLAKPSPRLDSEPREKVLHG